METQDGQLVGLNKGLEETSTRQQRDQKEMMEWATKKFAEMQRENELLREKLESTKREFKNFTFNIQGFDDDVKPRAHVEAKVDDTPAIVESPPLKENGFAMFSTEQGAAPDLLTKDNGHEDEEGNAPTSEVASSPSQRHVNSLTRNKSRRRIPSEVLQGWWKKAITAIIRKNRTARLAFGFTKTRVHQSQSLMARVERVEDQLFQLPIRLMRDVEFEVNAVGRQLTKEIKQCEEAVETGKVESQKSLEGITLAITSVRGDISALDGSLKDLNKMVEERTGSQSSKLQEMAAVSNKVKETEALHAQNLRKKIKNLMNQMKSLNGLYEEANALVYGLMARNAIVQESNGDESIVMLLKLDAQLRQARESVMAIDSAAILLSKLVSNLKDDILTSRHGNDSHIDNDDRDDLIGACDHIFGVIEKVAKGVKHAQEFCKQHDENLATRWMGFANVIQAAKSTATLSAKLKGLQTELEEKPTQQQLREAMAGAATDITPISNQISELKDIISKQREEMDEMKSKLVELQDKQHMLASKSGSRPASAVGTVLPPIQPGVVPAMPFDTADIGKTLQPMIKDIIDAYMKAWTEENLPNEEDSVSWVDNQQDDDSWYQGGNDDTSVPALEPSLEPVSLPVSVPVSPPLDAEPTPEFVTESDPTGSDARPTQNPPLHTGESLENATTPVFEACIGDHDADVAEVVASSKATSRESSRPPSSKAESRPQSRGAVVGESSATTAYAPSAPVSAQATTPQGTASRQLPTISPSKPVAEHASPRIETPLDNPAESRPASRPSSKGNRQGNRSRRASEAQVVTSGSEKAPNSSSNLIPRVSSGKQRSSRSDRGADSATVMRLREELKEVTNKIEAMYANKMDAGDAQSLLRGKADKISLSEKADVRVIETIETTLGKVAAELGDLREIQKDGLKQVKEQMATRLDKALKDLLQSERDSTRGVSLAATKAFCLSCGRESVAKQNAMPSSPRSYLPSLNRSISPGPAIHRGGFQMPATAPSGSTVHKAVKSVDALPGSPPRSALQLKSPKNQMLFSRSLSTALYNPEGAATFNDDDSAKTGLMQPVPDIPIVPMPIGNNIVRPMYRKGFPAKKSSRPVCILAIIVKYCFDVAFNFFLLCFR